jgi:rubredoxin
MNDCVEKSRHKCLVCGYVYDPEIGDIKGHIVKDTSFNKLPNDWQCPICRSKKEKFKRIERRCCI